MRIRLGIIVATTGRPTLRRTLRSIAHQRGLTHDDTTIVIGTDFWWVEPPTPEEMKLRARQLKAPGGDWGNLERAAGTDLAIKEFACTHIVYCDDDDAMLPGAISAIKRALTRNPDRPHMFRMLDPNGAVLWIDPELRMGNVGTPMFVFPADPLWIGEWPRNQYEGDFAFMQSTLERYPGGDSALIWDSTIIVGCREWGNWNNPAVDTIKERV